MQRSRVIARGPAVGLRNCFLIYLAVEVTRIQDMLKPLQLIFPGTLALIFLLYYLAKSPWQARLTDSITKLVLAFLLVICISVIPSVNQYWLYQSFKLVALAFVAYIVAMPLLATAPHGRVLLMRTLCLSSALLAIWCILHEGHGPGGYVEDENDAASVLAVGSCASYFLSKVESGTWRLVAYCTLGLTLCAIVATISRGGFLGLVASMLALAYFSGRFFRVLLGLVVVAIIAFNFVPKQYIGEVESITDQSNGTRVERIYSWGIGWSMFLEHPLLGVGAGNYPWRVGEYEVKLNAHNPHGRPTLAGRVSHSLYFTLIPETGLLGTSVFLSLVVVTLRRCLKAIRSNHPDATQWKAWSQVTGSALVGYLVGNVHLCPRGARPAAC